MREVPHHVWSRARGRRHLRPDFQPGASGAAGASLLVLWLAGACGGAAAPRPAPAPTIASFTTGQSPITAGGATTLTAVFEGGTATVDQGVGPVASGIPASTGALDADTRFTLSVTAAGVTLTRSLTVAVVPAPQQPLVSAPAALTSGAEGQASVAAQAGMTFRWTISGGTFPGGGAAATGDAVTFTAGGAGTLRLSCTAANLAGAESSPGTRDVPVVAPPVILRFAPTHASLPAGSATTLVAAFAGGAATVDHGLGAVTSGEAVPTGALSERTTYTLTVTNAAGTRATAQATVGLLPASAVITFTSEGDAFAPVIVVEGSPVILWTFADGTTSASTAPAKAYGTPGTRLNTLSVTPWRALKRINLGYDAGDGGSPAIELVPDQHVSAVQGLEVVAPTLAQWCSSYNDLTALDFSDFTNLDTIECFRSQTLRSVGLANTPRLSRACFEDGQLSALDLSGSPRLADLRGALNDFPTIELGGATFPETWHVCLRDNPQLADRALFASTARFPSIAELFIWATHQAGELRLASTHPTMDVAIQAFENQYTALHLAGALRNPAARGLVSLQGNRLTHVDLDGCVQLTELYLADNLLAEPEVDAILATLDGLGRARRDGTDRTPLVVDLRGNASPSAAGRASAVRLAAKGWTILAQGWTEPPP